MLRIRGLTGFAVFATLALAACDRDPPEEEIMEEAHTTAQQVDQATPDVVPAPVPVPVPVPVDTTRRDTMSGMATDTPRVQ